MKKLFSIVSLSLLMGAGAVYADCMPGDCPSGQYCDDSISPSQCKEKHDTEVVHKLEHVALESVFG